MQGKHWLMIVSLLVLALSGCRATNPYHCPDGSECPPVGGPCESSGECRAPTPVCKEDSMTCVECLASSDCASTRPLCSTENTCVQCQTDDDCDSKLCLMDGSCAPPNDVTYVGGANAAMNKICSVDTPCQNLLQALDPMVPPHKYIKVTGSIASDVVTFDKKSVIIYGRSGAQISRTTAGEVLIVKTTSDVTMIDLEIIGNSTSTDKDCVEIIDSAAVTITRVNLHNHGQAGIAMSSTGKLTINDSQIHENTADGVKATSGTVEINRSSISGNKGTAGVFTTNASMVTIESSTIAENTGSSGGVSITGRFTIRNSIIARNGAITSTTGGLALNSTNGLIDFSTIANNGSDPGGNAGIACSGTVAVSNSILSLNSSTTPISSSCNVTYSLWNPVAPSGNFNVMGDPMFIQTMERANPGYFRIGSSSPARGKADQSSSVNIDIDGQPRDDGMKDVGADEFK